MFRARHIRHLLWALLLATPVACFEDTGSSTSSGASASGTSQGSSGSGDSGAGGSSQGGGTGTTGTGSATASTGVASTGVMAGCGDGIIDPGEECDDGNQEPGDACHSDCTLYKLVFVSTSGVSGKADGLDGADLLCNTDAQAVGLQGTFKAWLSTDQDAPATRFAQAEIPYRRPDGVMIAKDWADLVDGTLAAPINLGLEGASFPDVKVWTGTLPDGSAANATCSNWTTTGDLNLTGLVGSTKDAGTKWSQSGFRACKDATRLYCFQQ